MPRRQRLDAEQRERLRRAYWEAEDKVPTTVPDTHSARAAYERESVAAQVVSGVQRYMADRGITQQELARDMDLTESRVSQILSGQQNLTIQTLASLAAALKGHFLISFESARGGPWETDHPRQDGSPESAVPAPVEERDRLQEARAGMERV